MANKWVDIIGTTLSYIRIGLTGGLRLKNNSGVLEIKNGADSAFADLLAKVLKANDPDVVLDADGNALTISRHSSQSGALQIIFPAAKGTDGQVFAQKASTGSGVLEFELVSAASTASCEKVDTTSLAFGTSSPLALFTTGAGDVITKIQVIVDTAFDGTPTVSIGVSGTASKYMPTSALDLTVAGVYEYHPGLAAQGSEALIATYSAGGATQGAARILVYYGTPA